MAKQSLIWTALPNGYSEDKKALRVSLLLSPRLDPEAEPEVLETFPDFFAPGNDWPATLHKTIFTLSFAGEQVSIAGDDYSSPSRMDDRLGKPDSEVWRALFSGSTPVHGYHFTDSSKKKLLSYQVKDVDDLVQGLYGQLAASATDQLPTAVQILSIPSWSTLVAAVAEHDNRFTNEKTGLRDVKNQFAFFADGGFKNNQGLVNQLGIFELFHTPPSTPVVDKYNVPPEDPRSKAQWLGYKQTALPEANDFQDEFDFHKIVAAMGQYPTLLRKLGLVVDLLVDRNALPAAANAALYADVELPEGSQSVTRTQDTSPRTRTRLDSAHFDPLPRPTPGEGDYRVVDGMLELNPDQFHLVQADPDGALLKVMNFARTLFALQQDPGKAADPVSKKERETGAPAIRNAGLMLVHDRRADMLKNSLGRQKKFYDAAALIQNGAAVAAPDLYAEDLVRGYRVDIWDGDTNVWRSLCLRKADYDLNAGQKVVEVPQEEGTVKLAATASPDPTSNPDVLWLHEAVLSWTGWSLCVPQPGKTIHHHRDADPTKDHVDEVGGAEAEVPPGLKLHSKFTAIKGSLPRLRYGRSYWVRARVVDLAGNSLDTNSQDIAGEDPGNHAQQYFRYEPILAPALTLVKPSPAKVEAPAEGESMERMAVRTFNDTPAGNSIPSTQHARRFGVPPRTTAKEAEYHGMFDQNGQVDASFFGMLAAKDNPLLEEKILSAGPLDQGTPVETGYAVLQEGEALPYLPDPLAVKVAARIFDLPGFSSNTIIPVPLYAGGKSWPNALPFKIELLEDSAMQPHFDETTRTLFVPIGKAERLVLRLSVRPSIEALKLLGVWSWLSQAQQTALQKMALNGQHWMLTPWREISLVHAVQRPLITPEIQKIRISRPFAATYATPTFTATCSIKSSDHLDLLAEWNEPSEDTTQKTGANLSRTDHAFAVKITTSKTYAGAAEYKLVSPDLVLAGGMMNDKVQRKDHHFNDTRYRRIEYHLDATTQFREFLPASLLTELVDGSPAPTDKNIKVSGPKTRTWIPSSAPPPAPEVLYVVPTFGWVRSNEAGKQTSWRRGGGLRIYLNRTWNASGYGEMLAVVLPSAAFTGDPSLQPASQPLKNFVTQWGNDPAWKSAYVPGAAPKRSSFPLARTAADPAGAWLPGFAPQAEADQPPGQFAVTSLVHPQIQDVNNAQMRVDIAPHDVFYDEERRLWYSDIELNWGSAYYPFIRLALARYQPVSVGGAHLSHIVLADFMQLVPDRWLNVTKKEDPRTRHVSVYGYTFTDSSGHVEARNAPVSTIKLPDGKVVVSQAVEVAPSTVVEIWVERLNPAMGEDFGWQREPGAKVSPDSKQPKKKITVADKKKAASQRTQAKTLLHQRNYRALATQGLIDTLFITPTLWSGSVTLPASWDEGSRYRLAIAEYEEYIVDDTRPYDPIPKRKDRRLVFIEYVELD